ncbi:MAG: tetratricopeptide repeat protein, partial [Planctomycetes bacterium]|nr:tetratricopeptide repeat protein [Planctomycetota bacterium]
KGDRDGALKGFREAERIDRKAFGDDHPEVATDVNNIGGVLFERGDLAGAREKMTEAFRIFVRTYGPRSLETVQVAKNLLTVDTDPIAIARELVGDDAADALAEAMAGGTYKT